MKAKKLIVLGLLAILLLSTFACGDGGEEATPTPTPTPTSTSTPTPTPTRTPSALEAEIVIVHHTGNYLMLGNAYQLVVEGDVKNVGEVDADSVRVWAIVTLSYGTTGDIMEQDLGTVKPGEQVGFTLNYNGTGERPTMYLVYVDWK